MARNKTTIVCWPACQELMDCEGFSENSALCSSGKLYKQYGDSAYAVSNVWLDTLPPSLLNDVFSLQEAYPGPEVDFESDDDFIENEDGFKII